MQLKISTTCYRLPRVSRKAFRVSAFTLMELMVSVGIMVIIILSIGVTFSGASKSVSVSNATMEMMSSIRATQSLIERDVTNIDRNGYIAIRCRLHYTSMPLPLGTVLTPAERSERFDQISFITFGSFPNHTGANPPNPFTDSSTTSAALAWWGQGVLEAANTGNDPSILSSLSPNGQHKVPTSGMEWAGVPPTGFIPAQDIIKENEFTLMRHLSLLFPGPLQNGSKLYPAGRPVMAYPTAGLDENPILGAEGNAHITSSRYSVVAQTPAQIMQYIMNKRGTGPLQAFRPEIDLLTYRFRALASVYDTEVTTDPFVNGYFRTTPIVMQGVSSFKIEWTDGNTYPTPDPLGRGREGQLKWYGPTNPLGDGTIEELNYVNPNFNTISHTILGQNVNLQDHYTVYFNYENKAKWPKALRFTMHVASDRLNGGRDFVQVVNLPQ